jgi:RHS repeat-associated protein
MGSVIGLVDASGNIQSRIVYDGFGNVESGDDASSLGGDFRFQGQWLEGESGLYYMRARDYDSQTGLFLSRDAVDVQEQGVEAFNPYQFAFGNPLVYSDPTGLISITEINATLEIEQILFTIEQRTKQEILSRFKDKALEAAGEIFWKALSSFLPTSPFTAAIQALSDSKGAGELFEAKLKEQTRDMFSQMEITILLLSKGANPSIGYTEDPPLINAVLQSDINYANDLVKILLSKGAFVDPKSCGSSHTPLTLASYYGQLEIVKMLVNAGADVNYLAEGEGALFCAASQGHVDIYEYLLPLVSDLEEIKMAKEELYYKQNNIIREEVWKENECS